MDFSPSHFGLTPPAKNTNYQTKEFQEDTATLTLDSDTSSPSTKRNQQSKTHQKDVAILKYNSNTSFENKIIKCAAKNVKLLTNNVCKVWTEWWQGGPLPPPPPPHILRPNEITIEIEKFIVYDKPIDGGFIEVALADELQQPNKMRTVVKNKKNSSNKNSTKSSKHKWVLV